MQLVTETESNLPGMYLPLDVKKLPPLYNSLSPAALIATVAKPISKNVNAKIFILLTLIISLVELNTRAVLTDVVGFTSNCFLYIFPKKSTAADEAKEFVYVISNPSNTF